MEGGIDAAIAVDDAGGESAVDGVDDQQQQRLQQNEATTMSASQQPSSSPKQQLPLPPHGALPRTKLPTLPTAMNYNKERSDGSSTSNRRPAKEISFAVNHDIDEAISALPPGVGGGLARYPLSSTLNRNLSNQSTIDSGLSRNSHLDNSDPNIRRMFYATNNDLSHTEKHRKLRMAMDQCETVRFPFKKRLVLANLNLTEDELPIKKICGETLGSALYKLNLAGNRLSTIPTPLIVQLTGLRVLDLSQCDLYTLPERWDLPSLKKLILSHNRIQTCFPEVSIICLCVCFFLSNLPMSVSLSGLRISNAYFIYLNFSSECLQRSTRIGTSRPIR